MGETQSRESLDAEHDWSGVDAVEGFDMGECMLQLTEWAGVQEEDHIDELGIRVGWIDRRMSAGDSDSMVGKDPGDFCDDARSVCHVKSDIIRGRCIADWDESAGRAIRQESAMATWGGKRAGGLHQVCHDRRGGGILTGSAAVKQ